MTTSHFRSVQSPDISIVVPCYNEEAIIGYSLPKLSKAFRQSGYRLELVAVDNGSFDRTGEIIRELASQDPSIVPHRVEHNEGYGNGLLSGLSVASAPWVCFIPADGQVDAEDTVRLFEAAVVSGADVVAKARRRFRIDGLTRKLVSTAYNVFIRVLWPTLPSIDVNGSPKIAPRALLLAMQLESKDWFLDPEIVLKAHYMGVRILEFNVFARLRGNGLSHVRANTCWEFTRNLLKYRLSGQWKKCLPARSATPANRSTVAAKSAVSGS
jgi:glycosyltransferase involved in cell wall biosynthesis